MSTNIIVDVALAALRQLNQAQVNANRQAKLLADRNAKLAQKAVDADAAAKAQQGQDRNGALLYGIRADRRRVQQPVAVFRTAAGDAGWLLVPSSTAWTVFRNAGFTPFSFAYQDPPSNGYYTGQVLATGPLGTNALETTTTLIGPSPPSPGYSTALEATTDITEEPATKEFTFEALLRIAEPSGDPDSVCYATIGNNVAEILIAHDRYSVSGVDTTVGRLRLYYGNEVMETFSVSNVGAGPPGYTPLADLGTYDVFHHVAIVQYPGSTDSSRSYDCYLNGARVFQGTDLTGGSLPDWLFGGSPYAYVYVNNANGADSARVHGVRFTLRALYSGASFTPPTSITSLA